MAGPLYIGSDKRINLTGLTGDGAYLNAATVTWALKLDADGVTVTGGTGTLAYTALSSGDYTGVIDRAVTILLSPGVMYRLEVTISSGAYDDFRRVFTKATYRGET